MANATAALKTDTLGDGPFIFDLPIAASTTIYKGTLVSQLATGYVVPYSTAASGVAIGVAQHDQSNASGSAGDKRVRVETMRAYALKNGTAGDAFADTDLIGSVVYATDDNTVAKTSGSGARRAVGFLLGFEDDGKVRVFIDPQRAGVMEGLLAGGVSRIQVAGGTFASGTATINAGITVTAATDAFVIMSANVTGSINVGCLAHIKASNVVGAPGVGAVTLRILGNDGAVDADAAGAFRVLLVN